MQLLKRQQSIGRSVPQANMIDRLNRLFASQLAGLNGCSGLWVFRENRVDRKIIDRNTGNRLQVAVVVELH